MIFIDCNKKLLKKAERLLFQNMAEAGTPETRDLSEKNISNFILSENGFTLIEVIVSMVIVSMITLVMAFALRINMQAWEHGVNEGDKVQVEVALSNLMSKQLRSIVKITSFNDGLKAEEDNSSTKAASIFTNSTSSLSATSSAPALSGKTTLLPFLGKTDALSFYTLYSPLGSPYRGLIRVSYIYDSEQKELKIYETIINSSDDIKKSDAIFAESTGNRKKSGKRNSRKSSADVPSATLTDIEQFSLSFLASDDSSELNSISADANRKAATEDKTASRDRSSSRASAGNSFRESWDVDSQDPPGFVKAVITQTKYRGGAPLMWLFKVGGAL